MWKAAAGQNVNINNDNDDDEWETDPDYVNEIDEQQQRWGSSAGRTAGAIDMEKLRRETEESDKLKKKKALDEGADNAAFGYGGKFGVQNDRMDKSAMGHEYIGKVEKHASQKDYSTGFGGKFGVQTDRVDKSAVSWDHKEKNAKHASQKDYVSGFGGKFGVQTDRQDKSAMGWDHIEKVEKHESQKDYVKGFGGKFGVQTDRQDKSAVGWDHHEAPQKHESQTDHKIGFGGKFGLQTDRVDKSAASFDDPTTKVGTNYTKVKPDIGGAKPSDLRAKFETMVSLEDSNSSKPGSLTNSPAPKKTVHAKAAFLNQEPTSPEKPSTAATPRQLDSSKTAFLTQKTTTQEESTTATAVPQKMGQDKMAQFSNNVIKTTTAHNQIKEELELLKQLQKQKQDYQEEEIVEKKDEEEEEEKEEEIRSVTPSKKEEKTVSETTTPDEVTEFSQDDIVDTGVAATALYDYQAAADDEISFDPDDLITHIEKIDEGWWRGLCKGKYGLFPANYVQCNE